MGSTWMVWCWVPNQSGIGYHDECQYSGESMLTALRTAFKSKRAGTGCVKVEWR